MDIYGLETTLEEVVKIDGVKWIGFMLNYQPHFDEDRLLVVQDELVRARIVDVTNPKRYDSAYTEYATGMLTSSKLLEVRENSLNEVINTFAKNERISFEFPDKELYRFTRN